MGKKNTYYLIKRNKQTNDYEIVFVNGKKGTSLEEIDLCTRDNILDLGKGSFSIEVDLFDYYIASVSSSGKRISCYELSTDYEVVHDLAKASLGGKLELCNPAISRIFVKFDYKMKNNIAFRRFVLSGNTDIYEKFYKYFIRTGHVNYHQDGDWAYKSYPLVRSVVSAMDFDYKNESSRRKKHFRNLCRRLLEKDILKETSPKYDENQLSFLEDMPIEINDQKLAILASLEKIPENVFIIDGEFVRFNDSLLPSCSKHDLTLLRELLPEYVRLIIFFFSQHNRRLDDNKKWKKLLQSDINNILSWLNDDPSNISKMNKWLELYNKYFGKVMGDDDASYTKEKKQQGLN